MKFKLYYHPLRIGQGYPFPPIEGEDNVTKFAADLAAKLKAFNPDWDVEIAKDAKREYQFESFPSIVCETIEDKLKDFAEELANGKYRQHLSKNSYGDKIEIKPQDKEN